jgi:hypothetical protein
MLFVKSRLTPLPIKRWAFFLSRYVYGSNDFPLAFKKTALYISRWTNSYTLKMCVFFYRRCLFSKRDVSITCRYKFLGHFVLSPYLLLVPFWLLSARDLVLNRGSQWGFKGLRALLPGLKVAPNGFIHHAGRPHSLSTKTYSKSVHSFFTMRLLILQRLQSFYAFILHYALALSPFVHTQRMHAFTTCTAGKKRTEEFGTKCILVEQHRERIG